MLDLTQSTEERIARNKRRGRLYPRLLEGFLQWWQEKRRWINEPFTFISENVKAQYYIDELKSVIKVENILALRIGDSSERIIYPYFCEEPALGEEAARLGLWLLKEALPRHETEDFRVLDVMRGNSFSLVDVPLRGNERQLVLEKFGALILEREKLRKEYG